MISLHHSAGRSREPLLARLLVILVLALGHSTTNAEAAAPRSVCVANQPVAGSSIMAFGFLGKFFSFVMSTLNTQQRLLQFGVIGMCIGLYILMRR